MKQQDVLISDMDYFDIPINDLEYCNLVVCIDPQQRLGEKTWVVLDNRCIFSKRAKGLFWEKDAAIVFARAYT